MMFIFGYFITRNLSLYNFTENAGHNVLNEVLFGKPDFLNFKLQFTCRDIDEGNITHFFTK